MKIIVIVGLVAILANSQDFIEFYSGFTGTNFDYTGWTVTNALSTKQEIISMIVQVQKYLVDQKHLVKGQ